MEGGAGAGPGGAVGGAALHFAFPGLWRSAVRGITFKAHLLTPDSRQGRGRARAAFPEPSHPPLQSRTPGRRPPRDPARSTPSRAGGSPGGSLSPPSFSSFSSSPVRRVNFTSPTGRQPHVFRFCFDTPGRGAVAHDTFSPSGAGLGSRADDAGAPLPTPESRPAVPPWGRGAQGKWAPRVLGCSGCTRAPTRRLAGSGTSCARFTCYGCQVPFSCLVSLRTENKLTWDGWKPYDGTTPLPSRPADSILP